MMSYEKLLVYQCSMNFLEEAIEIVEQLPRGNSSLGDQLKRASISVPLNIAEATGKTKIADKRRFFSIARGSAMECGACLDVYFRLKFTNRNRYNKNKELIEKIVAMLSKLARASFEEHDYGLDDDEEYDESCPIQHYLNH